MKNIYFKHTLCFHFLLIVIFSFSIQLVSAQSNYLNVSTYKGNHLTPDEKQLLNDPIYGFDVTYGKNVSTKDQRWVRFLHCKYLQYRAGYLNFTALDGAKDTCKGAFGHQFSLVCSMNLQLLHIGIARLYFAPSMGPCYITKGYYDDKRNRFTSSHINLESMAEVFADFALSPKIGLRAMYRFVHISNGGYLLPNLGMNTPNYGLGIVYQLSAKK